MSRSKDYTCDRPGCEQRFSEDGRTNVRGELHIESAGVGEKTVDVDMDLCPDHRNQMISEKGIWVPLIDLREISFETEI